MKHYLALIILLILCSGCQSDAQKLGNHPAITVENAASVIQLGVLDTGNATVLSLTFSPNGILLLSTHPDGIIQEWDLTTGTSSTITSPGATWVRAAAYSPDGKQIASGDAKNVILWNAESKEQLAILEGHTDSISVLAYNSDGTILASGSRDYSIRLWNVESHEELHVLQASHEVKDMVFSPDGTIIAAMDGNIAGVHLWDTSTGTALDDIIVTDVYFDSISFNMDGSLLAGAGSDGNIYIWNMETRELIHTMEGHEGRVSDLSFSPSANLIVSSGEDKTLRLWDAERSSGFSPLRNDFVGAYRIAYNAAGTLFASAQKDGLIYLWGVSDADPLPLPELEAFTVKSGHWAGGNGDITVKFDVDADGNIINYYWSWRLGTSTCSLNQEELVEVKDNVFSFGPSVQHFDGKFRSASSLFGQSDVTQCGNQFIFTTGGPPTWWVEWQSE